MANKTLFDGRVLVDLGAGGFAEKVVAVNPNGSAIGASGGTVTAATHLFQGRALVALGGGAFAEVFVGVDADGSALG